MNDATPTSTDVEKALVLSQSSVLGNSTSRAEELTACCTPSISSSGSLLQHEDLRSTYHIYHIRESHKCISSTTDPPRERFWGPTVRQRREERRQKSKAELRKQGVELGGDVEQGTFFLHSPYLAFHNPPRVLYVGSTKHAEPAVLIHNSPFWRSWKLQFGPSIAKPGVLDPRGIICWKHNGGDNRAREVDGKLLRGYKVRTWRIWGETGKKYVQTIKANRKNREGYDPDVVVEEAEQDKETPIRADGFVYLKWASPLSRDTRRYHFHFAGIDFFWKGTGTVKESRTCGFLVRFNHLKLVACLPLCATNTKGGNAVTREVCLGKYTSSIAVQKSGILELHDEAIWRLIAEHHTLILSKEADQSLNPHDGGQARAQAVQVKKTLLYQTIIATAMCMIIGEKQKRETVRGIIETACGEIGGAAN